MDKRGKLWYNTPYYGRLCPEEESGMGKLIVFEGTDGSGKATQSALLCQELEKRGIAFRKLEFPRYQDQ